MLDSSDESNNYRLNLRFTQNFVYFKSGSSVLAQNKKLFFNLLYDASSKFFIFEERGKRVTLEIIEAVSEYGVIKFYNPTENYILKLEYDDDDRNLIATKILLYSDPVYMTKSYVSGKYKFSDLKKIIEDLDFSNADTNLISKYTHIDGIELENNGQRFHGAINTSSTGFELNGYSVKLMLMEIENRISLFCVAENGNTISIYPDGGFVFKNTIKNPTQYYGDNLYFKKDYVRLRNLAENFSESKSTRNPEIKTPSTFYSSGFIVSKEGFVLTCHHSIKDTDAILVFVNKKAYSASVIYSDVENDVALISIDDNGGKNFKHVKTDFSYNAKLGEKIITIGFPNPDLQGFDPKYSEGAIAGINGLRDNPNQYQISNPIQPGNSGGALFNSSGEAIGVITSKLNFKKTLSDAGYLPENVNFASKLSKIDKNITKIIGSMANGSNYVTVDSLRDTCVLIAVQRQ
jgi:S1-C subfamily serine protease